MSGIVFGLVLTIHILVSLILIGVILLQGGRGGLSEALGGAAAQSLFGGGVATVLTRITAICAALFVVTCLSLAYLSTAQSRSVIEQLPTTLPEALPLAVPGTEETAATSVPPTPSQSAEQSVESQPQQPTLPPSMSEGQTGVPHHESPERAAQEAPAAPAEVAPSQ